MRVGIFVLAGLLVLGFLILNATGDFNPFERKLHLKAHFADADGLREGAEVQLAGVHIGKVDSVDLLPPDSEDEAKVEAIIIVDRNLGGRPITERIRTDSTAQLVATSLLANDKMINISPGSPKGTPVAENHILPTTTGNDLLEQINKLSVPANEILQKANRGEGTLGKIVNDDSLYKNLDATVAETKVTMAKLQNTFDLINNGQGSAGKLLNDPALYNNLNRTVSQLEQISRDIRAGRGTAGKLINDDALYNDTRAAVADLRVTASKLNGIADDFKVITNDLNEGRGTAGKFLKDDRLYEDARVAITRLNSTAGKFELILGDAQSGKGTLGKLLTDETLFNNVNQTASNVNQLSSESTKLIYDFRQNPKKYLTIKFKLF